MSRRTLKSAINDDLGKEQDLADFVFNGSNKKEVGSTEDSLVELPVNSIHRTSIQKRRYFNESQIQDWAENEIKLNGIRSPLWVRPLPNSEAGQFELIAGERRYRAALFLKLKTVPVRIFHLDDKQALIASLVENMQRQDLNPLEETEGTIAALSAELEMSSGEAIKLLYQMNNASKGKINQNVLVSEEARSVEKVFSTLGRLSWKSFVSARLPLLKKPEDILEALREGKIEYTKAILISKIKDDEERAELLSLAISENWSLNDVKEQVALLMEMKGDISKSSLEKEVKATLSNFKKSQVWNDPKKAKKIERLLEQMQKLMDS